MDYLASLTVENRELLRIYYQFRVKAKEVDTPLLLGFVRAQR
jgi:hypothetical protein